MLSVVQTSGSNSRTVGINYDLLGRVGCEQTAAPTITWNGACSAGSPLVQNTYDTTKIGTQGSTDFPVGRLTQRVATTYFPDSTSATTTEQFQYDQRGRTITAQMQLGLPAGWSVSTALPIFQLTQAYNDADQPTTTNTNASGFGYTFTQLYDATSGVPTGLANNAGSTANLATLSYNVNALPDTLSFSTSTGASGLATEQFGYDGDLRPTSATAIWASSSGQSGSLFSQTRSYDNAGNVISLTTTQAQVQGQSASGGSQTENFCYDDQNRLIWAGNSGTQPGAGSGTCGAGTLGNTLSGAGYTSGYVYTNLGQLWQGPTAGNSQISQYLYCDSSHPHRLSGIYPIGTTCATTGSTTPVYSASYDAWGNVTARTYNNVTATLSYDPLNRMVQWSAGSSGQQQYVYDASGQRVLTRTTSGSTTSLTVYAFGLQELHYHGDGTPVGGTSNCYYYYLAGQLIGKTDGTTTSFFLSDGLGSVVASFSNTAGSAGVVGNQTYEPYGKSQYQQGSLGTSKGYTGQDADSLSGLDYYHARSYDPIAGIFLSPDSVQGNVEGMNPYAYVAGNPETATDPTGAYIITGTGAGGGTSLLGSDPRTWPILKVDPPASRPRPVEPEKPPEIVPDVPDVPFFILPGDEVPEHLAEGLRHVRSESGGTSNSGGSYSQFALNSGTLAAILNAAGASLTHLADLLVAHPATGGSGGFKGPTISIAGPSSPCSFTSDTQVMTAKGKKAIGDLQVGEKVMAYNPKTHKMELEPILHVWKHTDSDLIDLTVTIETPAHDGKPAHTESETVHTTSEHPFLTKDQGFVPAGKLKMGTRLVRADGSVGVVTGWKMLKATRVMYNLEVAQDHTFTVGSGRWVVHNACGPLGSSGGGPGKWDSANESMSSRAAKYQQQITGCPTGIVYRVGDVKFDGFDGTSLLDAKGPGYAKFVQLDPETGAAGFKSWWKGADGLVDEANRQIGVAGGWPIVWHIAEALAYTAINNLFKAEGISGIKLCLTPPT